MGVRFVIQDAANPVPWSVASFLRPYFSKRQAGQAGAGLLGNLACQSEADTKVQSLMQILDQESAPLIALFGLDENASEKIRWGLQSAIHEGGWPIVELTEAGTTGVSVKTEFFRERLIKVADDGTGAINTDQRLHYMPSCLFVLDLTSAVDPKRRQEACQAINGLADSFASMPQKQQHRVLVLMGRRFWLDTELSEAYPYLRSTPAWYRIDVGLSDTLVGDQYQLEDCAESTGQRVRAFGLTFVPREAVFAGLVEAITRADSGREGSLVLVSGDAGTGKSTILLDLADHLDAQTAYVSAGFSHPRGWTRMDGLLKEVCHQICQTLGWDASLTSKDTGAWREQLMLILTAASKFVAGGNRPFYTRQPFSGEIGLERRFGVRRIVVAIDALDELDPDRAYDAEWLMETLSQCVLPGLHFVVTARPGVGKLPGSHLNLDLGADEFTRRDIQDLVKENQPDLKESLQSQICALGDGNLLATALILSFLSPLHPQEVEEKITDWAERVSGSEVFGHIYAAFWERARKRAGIRTSRAAQVIGDLFARARPPLPPSLVYDVAEERGVSRDASEQFIDQLVQDSLIKNDVRGCWIPFHWTLVEWLAAERNSGDAGERCKPTGKSLTGWCALWDAPDRKPGTPAFEYALRYANEYLAEAHDWEGLYDLLVGKPDGRSFRYLEARLDDGPFAPELEDDLHAAYEKLASGTVALSGDRSCELAAAVLAVCGRASCQSTMCPDAVFPTTYQLLRSHPKLLASPATPWLETVASAWSRRVRPWLKRRSRPGWPLAPAFGAAADRPVCSPVLSRDGHYLIVATHTALVSYALTPDHANEEWRQSPNDLQLLSAEHIDKLSLSPCSRYLAFCTESQVAILDRVTQEPITGFPNKLSIGVQQVAFSPNGRFVAIARDGLIEIFEIPSMRPVWAGQCQSPQRALALTADAARIAVGCEDGSVMFWETGHDNWSLSLPTEGYCLHQHASRIESVALSNDGNVLASASCDKIEMTRLPPNGVTDEQDVFDEQLEESAFRVRGLYDLEEEATLHGWYGGVYMLEFSPDARYLACAGDDGPLAVTTLMLRACPTMKTRASAASSFRNKSFICAGFVTNAVLNSSLHTEHSGWSCVVGTPTRRHSAVRGSRGRVGLC